MAMLTRHLEELTRSDAVTPVVGLAQQSACRRSIGNCDTARSKKIDYSRVTCILYAVISAILLDGEIFHSIACYLQATRQDFE